MTTTSIDSISSNIDLYKSTALSMLNGELNIYRSNTGISTTGSSSKTKFLISDSSLIKTSASYAEANPGAIYIQGWSDRDEVITIDNAKILYSNGIAFAGPILTNTPAQALNFHRRGDKAFICYENYPSYAGNSAITDISLGTDIIISQTTAASPDGQSHAIFIGENYN